MEKIRARAVLFDLDGVLAQSGQLVEAVWREWARRHGIAEERAVAHSHGRPADEVVRRLAPHLDPDAEATWMEERELRHPVAACPGAVELTESLRLPWAVVTSGRRRTATARLAAIGVRRPRVLVTASDVGRGKPHPEGYLTAAHDLGVAPEQCVVVEDSRAGVSAARAAGAKVVGIDGPALDGVEVDVLVDSLQSLRIVSW